MFIWIYQLGVVVFFPPRVFIHNTPVDFSNMYILQEYLCVSSTIYCLSAIPPNFPIFQTNQHVITIFCFKHSRHHVHF